MTETDNDSDAKQKDARTAWAEDRTVLANERTYAAWLRTGMTSLGVALGLRAVFSATEYPMIAKGVAELFVFCAILIFWSAARRSRHALSEMETHDTSAQSDRNMVWTSTALVIGSIATGVILFLL